MEKEVLEKVEALEADNEVEEAIGLLEDYLSSNKKLGKVYSKLMNLYNLELKSAREKGDSEEIIKLMDKIDDLMKLSKDVIRGRL